LGDSFGSTAALTNRNDVFWATALVQQLLAQIVMTAATHANQTSISIRNGGKKDGHKKSIFFLFRALMTCRQGDQLSL
jgi:hypothetical protein